MIEQLSAPFEPAQVSWRVGSTNQDKTRGMALAYIDARDVMTRLDAVCGPFGWQSRHEVSADGKKVTCHIGIRAEDGTWVWKSDGAGETDYEGEKGSYSDSLKRAAVSWGIGRYLYDLAAPWVAVENRGKTSIIPEAELARLRKYLAGRSTITDSPAEAEPAPARTPAKPKAVEPAPPAPPPGAIVSKSTRARLLEAMAKQNTRTQLKAWSDSERVREAIEGLADGDRVFFDAAFSKHWNALPETTAMAG